MPTSRTRSNLRVWSVSATLTEAFRHLVRTRHPNGSRICFPCPEAHDRIVLRSAGLPAAAEELLSLVQRCFQRRCQSLDWDIGERSSRFPSWKPSISRRPNSSMKAPLPSTGTCLRGSRAALRKLLEKQLTTLLKTWEAIEWLKRYNGEYEEKTAVGSKK